MAGKKKKIILGRRKQNQVLKKGSESEMSKLHLQMSEGGVEAPLIRQRATGLKR